MILAVDPGVHGALCFRWPCGRTDVFAMPTYERKVGSRMRATLDEARVCQMILGPSLQAPGVLVIEQVGGLPGQSAAAAFTFGQGFGTIITAARMCGYRIERVTPNVWKPALRVPRDKQSARARASELMPECAHLWPLKGDDGKAEAALLALYAERNLL